MPANLFHKKSIAVLCLLPQLCITLIFFVWPAYQAIVQSLYQGDPFGLSSKFVGLNNYIELFESGTYFQTLIITLVFSLSVTFFTLVSSLLMAYLVENCCRGKTLYKTLLIWPYAVAPAVAAILWRFIFTPAIGWGSYLLQLLGIDWNYLIYPHQAFFMIVVASCWQQFSYNFLFFFAGLQSIPQSLVEAASIDGANAWQRFRHIIFPLLSPTTFFLVVTNLIYAFFDTFGVIQVMTQGGPAGRTATLVYKVYNDGFMGLDFGGSAAQSVVLMIIISLLMLFQFRYIEKKVTY